LKNSYELTAMAISRRYALPVQFKRFNVATTIYSSYLTRCTGRYMPIHLC